MFQRLLLLITIGLVAGAAALGSGSAVKAGHDTKSVSEGSIPLTGTWWGKPTVLWSLSISGGAPANADAAVRDALGSWAHNTADNGFTLREAGGGEPADITVQVVGGGGRIAGSAQWNAGSDGQLSGCSIRISGKSFGNQNTYAVLLSVALHETGHCLGLGHATSKQDVMYDTVQNPAVTQLSDCDLKAWRAVMAWLLNGTTAAPPTVSSVACGDGSGGGGGTTVDVTISYSLSGPQGRDLVITVALDPALSGITVSITLTREEGGSWSGSGNTNSEGKVSFRLRNAPSGHYKTSVNSLSGGLTIGTVTDGENNDGYVKP
jgi:hypothetical protein